MYIVLMDFKLKKNTKYNIRKSEEGDLGRRSEQWSVEEAEVWREWLLNCVCGKRETKLDGDEVAYRIKLEIRM